MFLGWEPHPMNANFELTYLVGRRRRGSARTTAAPRSTPTCARASRGMPERRPAAQEPEVHARDGERDHGRDPRRRRGARGRGRRPGSRSTRTCSMPGSTASPPRGRARPARGQGAPRRTRDDEVSPGEGARTSPAAGSPCTLVAVWCRLTPRKGSTTPMPQPPKSVALRVAMPASRERAIAAVCASNCPIGRPAWRRAAAIAAYASAAARRAERARQDPITNRNFISARIG